jgi:Caenorhabditis protein of unknown function, DUF268
LRCNKYLHFNILFSNEETVNLKALKKFPKKLLKPLAAVAIEIGFDPRKLRSIRYIPRYIYQYWKYRKLGGIISQCLPHLSNYFDQAGTASGHYFHQDLLVASFIFQKNPNRHIDIGSRIDGFVAHVASFRKIEIMDIRKLSNTGHSNISCIQTNLMDTKDIQPDITDSISCLHAIEHFGLGRYGDPIDPYGHIKGFNNLVNMLQNNGTLYISFPIGRYAATYFNAHRVFHPLDILKWARQPNILQLKRFDFVDDSGNLHREVDLLQSDLNLSFGCGIYTFKKVMLLDS